jgi:hypothetical protein
LLLAVGLTFVVLFTFVVSTPGGLKFALIFLFGVVPAVVGAAMLWHGYRSSAKSRDPEAQRVAGLMEQIVWRAVATGGRTTTSEAAAHTGRPQTEVEFALMTLVSEGLAAVEPSESGEIVYRIDSPVLGGD